MADSARVTLKYVPEMVRNEKTKHPLPKPTMDLLTNELGPLRDEVKTLKLLLESKNAQIQRLENVVTTFQSFFQAQQTLAKTPQLAAGEDKQEKTA